MFLRVYTYNIIILVWLGSFFFCESFVHTAGLKQLVFRGLISPEDDAYVGIGKLLLQLNAKNPVWLGTDMFIYHRTSLAKNLE